MCPLPQFLCNCCSRSASGYDPRAHRGRTEEGGCDEPRGRSPPSPAGRERHGHAPGDEPSGAAIALRPRSTPAGGPGAIRAAAKGISEVGVHSFTPRVPRADAAASASAEPLLRRTAPLGQVGRTAPREQRHRLRRIPRGAPRVRRRSTRCARSPSTHPRSATRPGPRAPGRRPSRLQGWRRPRGAPAELPLRSRRRSLRLGCCVRLQQRLELLAPRLPFVGQLHRRRPVPAGAYGAGLRWPGRAGLRPGAGEPDYPDRRRRTPPGCPAPSFRRPQHRPRPRPRPSDADGVPPAGRGVYYLSLAVPTFSHHHDARALHGVLAERQRGQFLRRPLACVDREICPDQPVRLRLDRREGFPRQGRRRRVEVDGAGLGPEVEGERGRPAEPLERRREEVLPVVLLHVVEAARPSIRPETWNPAAGEPPAPTR